MVGCEVDMWEDRPAWVSPRFGYRERVLPRKLKLPLNFRGERADYRGDPILRS